MSILLIVVCFLLALLLSSGMIPLIMLVTYKKRLFDPIGGRKIHQDTVPRLGGVAFVPIQCFLFIVALVFAIKISNMDLQVESWALLPLFMLLLCGLGLLFLLGLMDDLIGVSYQRKFVAQIVVACFFPLSGLWVNNLYGIVGIGVLSEWIGMPLTVFLVILIINAINLIDGLDGLCSGVVGAGCLVLGSFFLFYGAWWHALFAFITLGLLIPFFYYNVFGVSNRRRRIFMGDTGSMTLGYTMAFLTISFAMSNNHIKPFSEGALVVALSALVVPVLDVARVMFLRLRAGRSMFKPDRNHLHHKFLQMGLSHRTTMLTIILLVLFFCLFNFITVNFLDNNIVILCDLCIWVGFSYTLDVLEKRHARKQVGEHTFYTTEVVQKTEIDLIK